MLLNLDNMKKHTEEKIEFTHTAAYRDKPMATCKHIYTSTCFYSQSSFDVFFYIKTLLRVHSFSFRNILWTSMDTNPPTMGCLTLLILLHISTIKTHQTTYFQISLMMTTPLLIVLNPLYTV